MSDILNPLHPVNPSQQVQEGSKVSKSKSKKQEYYENQEGVYLPSKGLFYVGEYNKIEFLNVRPLNYTDEDILTTESFYTNGTIFTELLKNVIIDSNGFRADNLVPIDRDTILIWLRSTSFGNNFEIEYQCPKCGKGHGNNRDYGKLTWDLNTLEIPQYEPEVLRQLEQDGCLLVTTPVTDIKVKLIVPTIGATERATKVYQEKKVKEKLSRDFYATSTLLSVVSGVEDNGKFIYGSSNVDSFFRKVKLPLSDSRFLLKEVSKLNLTYNTKQNFVCKDCGHIEEGVEMPILHKNFFWPES